MGNAATIRFLCVWAGWMTLGILALMRGPVDVGWAMVAMGIIALIVVFCLWLSVIGSSEP